MEQANQAVGRLDGLASLLPDLSLFIYAYIRKEAVLSSQIEGTQSSLSDLLLFENDEAPGAPIEDVQEVSNYVAAMTQLGLIVFAPAFRCHFDSFVRFTKSSFPKGVAAASSLESSGEARTGSVAVDLATRLLKAAARTRNRVHG